LAGEKILIAEDDPVTARFVSALLEEHGYHVLVAGDGEDAYRLALEHRPDLIITDLIMPYKDGFMVLRVLRNNDELAGTPIVILSMRDREEDIVRGLEEGADDYVVKPFNARELLARIRKQLDLGKAVR